MIMIEEKKKDVDAILLKGMEMAMLSIAGKNCEEPDVLISSFDEQLDYLRSFIENSSSNTEINDSYIALVGSMIYDLVNFSVNKAKGNFKGNKVIPLKLDIVADTKSDEEVVKRFKDYAFEFIKTELLKLSMENNYFFGEKDRDFMAFIEKYANKVEKEFQEKINTNYFKDEQDTVLTEDMIFGAFMTGFYYKNFPEISDEFKAFYSICERNKKSRGA